MCYFSLCYIPKLLKPLMAYLFSPSWCVRTFQWKMWQRPDSFLCSATFWTSQVVKARFNTPLLKRDLWFYWSFWLSCIFLKESHWTELALIVMFSRFFLFVFFYSTGTYRATSLLVILHLWIRIFKHRLIS